MKWVKYIQAAFGNVGKSDLPSDFALMRMKHCLTEDVWSMNGPTIRDSKKYEKRLLLKNQSSFDTRHLPTS